MAMATLRDCPPVGLWLVLLAAALPWLTWVPISGRWDATDVIQAPAHLLGLVPYLVAAVWIGQRDRCLGLFVGYVALYLLLEPGRFWLAHEATWILFGALGLVFVRDLSEDWRRAAASLLAWSGALEAVYVVLTAFGINPLGVTMGYGYGDILGDSGTLGHSTYAAAYLAILAPLAPARLLPFYAAGLIASHSILGVIAAAVGLLIRWRGVITPHAWGLGAATAALALWYRGAGLGSFQHRADIWAMTARDLLGAPWLGWGFGAFADRMIGLQMHAHAKPGQTVALPLGELFDTAHNEWLQLAYSGGVVALALLAAWIVAHRGMFLTSYAGSVASLALVAFGTFPFRLAAIAATAVVILGLATAGAPDA